MLKAPISVPNNNTAKAARDYIRIADRLAGFGLGARHA